MIHNYHVLFVALKSRSNADGVPIYCRITYNGNRKDFATGIRAPVAAWDQKKQRIKTKDAKAEQQNQQLLQLRADITKIFSAEGQKEEPFDVADIVHKVLHPEAAKEHPAKAKKIFQLRILTMLFFGRFSSAVFYKNQPTNRNELCFHFFSALLPIIGFFLVTSAYRYQMPTKTPLIFVTRQNACMN